MKELPSRPKDHPSQSTPTPLAVTRRVVPFCRKRIDPDGKLTWLDPCRGVTRAFYRYMPWDRRDWDEITEGKDFLQRTVACDVTMSNIPWHTATQMEFIEHAMALGGRHIIFLVPSRTAQGLRTKNELARRMGYGSRMKINLPRFPGNAFTMSKIQLVMMHWERGYRGPLDQYEWFK